MDTKANMIIAKGKIVTSDVSCCALNRETNEWNITFKSGKSFCYSLRNVLWLKNPSSLNPSLYNICYRGKSFDNIVAILSFKNGEREYWHICFSDGHEQSYDKSELQVQKSCMDNDRSKNVFAYLRRIAEEVSICNEDDTKILQKQYEKIEFIGDDTVLASYLNPEEYTNNFGVNAPAPVFPFGCNKSQFMAVTNALSNRISVIEGPPGTGKTQTILNLIANLVLNGKTVQIVSNNNSAIENVVEKLASPSYKLDFFVASLGKAEKKQAFINNQTGILPDIRSFVDDKYDTPKFYEVVKKQSKELANVFEIQNRLAVLKQERYSINLESKHYAESNDNNSIIIPVKKALSSKQMMQFLVECQEIFNARKKQGFISRFLFRMRYGIGIKNILNSNQLSLEARIQSQFYELRKAEIDSEISRFEENLRRVDAKKLMEEFTENSLNYFRSKLAKRYSKSKRKVFVLDDLWKKSSEFLKEYPVVLSTTYTSRSSLGKNTLFDYVIMDESSQVDVATGALALSCAKNAVIVGDTKQLSNIVQFEKRTTLQGIFDDAHISQAYNCIENSFLCSVLGLFQDRIPTTILREHYRCNPQIIEYCNHKFYNDELIVMTEGTEKSLKLVTTNAGNHERDRSNLRQAEIICKEILPSLMCPKSEIGIITPYKNQVEEIKKIINDPAIDVATIHKFQGREKDIIIFTTADDIVTDFSDDPNLINVAVSRAKKQFILVASEEEQPQSSNIGDLIGYIRYNNCDVQHSTISSVFDYLYRQYEAERLEYLKKHRRISEYDSENLMFALIDDVLKSRQETLDVVAHLPLYQLIRDYSKMTADEEKFIRTGLSHIDFLIYNRVTKKPILAIEVDGYWFHKEGTKQAERDTLKNHIFEVCHIPLIRFATNGSGERERLSNKLDDVMKEYINSEDNKELI